MKLRTGIYLGIQIFALLLLTSSCVSKKKVLYFQNIDEIVNDTIQYSYTSKLQPSDILQITVTSIDMKAVEPFNLMMSGDRSARSTVSSNGRQGGLSYIISMDGTINFPVLGQIQAAGLTRQELVLYLQEEIGKYALNPIVLIRVLNNEITVLGEVGRPGKFQIEDERIALPELLGMAGDISIYGKRTKVLIIREENGKKMHYYVDMTKADFINSPFYFLKQNDIVYVEPTNYRIQTPARGNLGFLMGATSFLISIILLITN